MKDRVVLVLGGGEGNGRAIALALAAKGAKVVVSGSPERDLGETVGYVVFGGGHARHYPGDDPGGAVDKAKSAFGGLDLVVGPETAVARFRAVAGCPAIVIPEGATEEEAVRISSSARPPGP